jgi:glycosidase
MYTLPGIPSIYYGSEFGIEGRKEHGSDAPLRPALDLSDYKDAVESNPYTALIAKLGTIHQNSKPLCYGEYKELLLTNRQYAYMRSYEGEDVIAAVNNDETAADIYVPYQGSRTEFTGALSGETFTVENGQIQIHLDACGGEILL